MKSKKERLINDVKFLTNLTPARNVYNLKSLEKAASYIEEEFKTTGAQVENQYFDYEGRSYRNVIARFNPDAKEKLILGAHYDVCGDTPGADDNGSAVAGILETARMIHENKPDLNHCVEIVAFNLEEPPAFASPAMGSAVHAKSIHDAGARVKGMVCLEMIGYFSDKPGSQDFPEPGMEEMFGDKGDFIVLVGRETQMEFVTACYKLFQASSKIRSFAVPLPENSPLLHLSDQMNYFPYGYNGIMVNDTSDYRNMNYHLPSDTIDTLDFDKMSEVVNGVYNIVINL